VGTSLDNLPRTGSALCTDGKAAEKLPQGRMLTMTVNRQASRSNQAAETRLNSGSSKIPTRTGEIGERS
jgi:hypothetical protein